MNETLTPAQKAAETREAQSRDAEKSWMQEVRDHQLIGDSAAVFLKAMIQPTPSGCVLLNFWRLCMVSKSLKSIQKMGVV